jgi:D-alanyl-lipoteichoic acid acyltransferase DltB (MBOAT superfamily)
MIFNSYYFIFLFLPVSLFFFYLTYYFKKDYAIYSIIILSAIFYSISSFKNLFLLIIILTLNFLSIKLIKNKFLFILVIFFNLLILVYFKFLKFLIDPNYIVIPLAISFYIFNQIAFIIDCYYQRIKKPDFKNFFFLILFFPHLMAGPFLRYNPIISQLKKKKYFQPSYNKFFFGLLIFSLGIFKKVVIADTLGSFVDAFHSNLDSSLNLDFTATWLSTFAFTFQLYFDFSGYSDMAIGISMFFGILLPANFNSPFKSKNFIEFWSKWHITLGKYIFEFIYMPLVFLLQKISNFKFKFLNIIKLYFLPFLISFLIVGIWHGSGRNNFLTFINFSIFGLLHGVFLAFNHLFKNIKFFKNENVSNFFGVFFTFNLVNFSFIFFRSASFDNSIKIIKTMFDFNSLYSLNIHSLKLIFLDHGFDDVQFYLFLITLLITFLIVFFGKNFNRFSENNFLQTQVLKKFPLIKSYIIFSSIILAIAIMMTGRLSSFIYFNF